MIVLPLRIVTAKLMDYSSSDYIPIMDGDVIVWKDFDYLRHTTNMTTYSEMADETEHLTEQFPSSHMVKILVSDVTRIRAILASFEVHHRNARSLNILGTALKVVAGTPDFDDFENVKFKQQELIESEIRQILVNTKTQAQINKLTEAVNIIIKNSKNRQIDTGHLYETLLARNRIIISELETLMLSVTLAKIGIINTVILDSNDLKNIVNKHSTNITVSDLVEVSFVKVLLDDNFIHFIIKYPNPRLECKKVSLFPVQHNGTILHLGKDSNVADCGNEILPIGNCSATLTTTFCRELLYPTCAQQFHSGGIAHCSTQPSHLSPLVVVDDGIIIINDDTAIIKNNETSVKTITGTFLLIFDDEIQVNGSTYKNLKQNVKKIPTSAAVATLNVTGYQEILSLPYLQKLGIQNLNYIKEVEGKLIMGPTLSMSIVILILLTYCLISKVRRRQMKKRQDHVIQATIDSFRRTEDGSHLSGGGVNVGTSEVPP